MTNYKLELRKSTHILCQDGKKWSVFSYPVDPTQKPFDRAEITDIGSFLNYLRKQVYAISDIIAIRDARKALGI